MLSFFAIAGGSVVPEMHRQTFAIRPLAHRSSVQRTCTPSRQRRRDRTPRLSPLLGHFIAGVPSQLSRCAGRVASSSARCCRLSNTFARRAGYITVQAGLVPVTIGLIDASALITVRDADHERTGFATSAATVALVYATRISPPAAFAPRGTPGARGFRVTSQ